MPAWDAESMTVEFPPSLAYLGDRVSREAPVWSPGLCAPGNTLQADGRRVVKTEADAAGARRCVSTEVGYRAPGKFLFAFAIEAVGSLSDIEIGVRTEKFGFGAESKYLGQDAEGWAYDSYNGKKHNGGATTYAEGAGAGDVIGVLLDLDVGTLSFLKNGRALGVAFSLPAGVAFFPCVSTYHEDTSILTLGIQENGEVSTESLSAPRWDARALVPFPSWMSFCRGRVTCVTPEWSPGLCAPGNALDLDGRKVVKKEVADCHRCVSTEVGFRAPGKYLFAFAIEDSATNSVFIKFGVRTSIFTYGSDNVFLGSTAEGWSYCAGDGKLYHNGGEGKNYMEGAAAKGGDVIGMLLDLDVGTLSFLKNGDMMGIAHCQLPRGAEYFPCVSTFKHGASVVTLSFEARDDSTQWRSVRPRLR